MKEAFEQYMAENFPDFLLSKPIYRLGNALRFELGPENISTAKEAYFTEAIKRARDIITFTLKGANKVFLVYQECTDGDEIAPNDLLIKAFGTVDQSIPIYPYKEDDGDQIEWRRLLKKIDVKNPFILELVTGIINLDFPQRSPRLNGELYILNIEADLIINVYDDRGMDIAGKYGVNLQAIYDRFKDWILEYNRAEIEEKIKSNNLPNKLNSSPLKLDDINEQIQRIASKLDDLKNLDQEFSIFGAENHRYTFNSPISEAEILAFEKEYGIQLPLAYRAFLLHFGNGGCGPNYGMLQLKHGIYDIPFNREESDNINLSNVFRFNTYWNLEDFPDDDYDAWQDEYDKAKWCDGMLRISHEGCGCFANLVLTGKERGNVWIDARASEAGIYPVNYHNGQSTTSFLDWYMLWLDKSLEKIKSAI